MSVTLKAVTWAWRFTQTVKWLAGFQSNGELWLGGTLETGKSQFPGTLKMGEFFYFRKCATPWYFGNRGVVTPRFPKFQQVVILFVWEKNVCWSQFVSYQFEIFTDCIQLCNLHFVKILLFYWLGDPRNGKKLQIKRNSANLNFHAINLKFVLIVGHLQISDW